MAVEEGTILRLVASLVFPDSVIMQNVFHLVLTTVVGNNDEEDIVTDLQEYTEDIYNELAPMVDTSIDSSDIKVYEYDSVDDDFDEIGTDVWVFAPSGTGGPLPHGVAGVLNLFTLDPDVQGRKFFGGVTEAAHTDGVWSAAALSDFGLAGAQVVGSFVSTAEGNVYAPGVWSPTHTNFYAYNGVVVAPSTPGYQRRRKPGVGI